METIRILVKENQVEIFFQTRNESSPVELIHVVQLSLIEEFIESWENWVRQCDILSFASAKKELNFRNRFLEFVKSLELLLFGTLPLKLHKKIVWILDDKIASLPVEILKISSEQTFYRNIRSIHTPPSGKNTESSILLVENHYRAEEILDELVNEREGIIKILQSKKLKFGELIGAGCTRIRFLEKAASASILHYSGHSFSRGIRFSDDSELINSELSTFNFSNLKLVSLNSCSSAVGLARAFLKAGALECVGFLGPVRNDVSKLAGKVFWEAYLEFDSVTSAVDRVREELQRTYGDGFPGAFQFVHFGVPGRKKIKQSKLIQFAVIGILLIFSTFVIQFINTPGLKEESKVVSTEKYIPEKKSDEKITPLPHNQTKITSTISTKEKSSPLRKKSNESVPYRLEPVFGSSEKLENYILSLKSETLKKKIREYLRETDPLINTEKKMKKLESILENNDSEEIIDYKLKQIFN